MPPHQAPASRIRSHDGTELAHWITGQGPPVVLTNGLTTNTAFWKYLEPRWARDHRVLRWDLPGHGESGPARSDESARIAEQPEHLVSLMDAARMETAVQIGWSTGSQVVLEMYRRYPERCAALVLLLGSAGRVLSTAKLPLPGALIEQIVQHTPRTVFEGAMRALAYAAHAPFGQVLPRRAGLIGRDTTTVDAALITEHLRRIHGPTVQVMIASAQEHSAWELLPDIEVPVLVVAGDRDPFAPAKTVGVRLHAECPGSELLRLPRATHTAMFDHAQEIGDGVEDFLRRRVPGATGVTASSA